MSPTVDATTTTLAAAADEEHIKTMQLYNDIERIDNELRARGIADGSDIDNPHILSKIDSMHYEGDDAIIAAIDALDLSPSSYVLDVGSGFGGPARLLAFEAKCHVVGMELQTDIHDKAQELTRRCKLDKLVHHSYGDILQCDTSTIGKGPGSFDAVVSWLVFLHISDKQALFSKCSEMLKAEGGRLFADDFFMLHPFTEEQQRSLRDDVYCANLPTREEYIRQLEDCGFCNIKFDDRTAIWSTYVNDRLRDFIGGRERFESVHGKPTYDHLLHFYKAVCNLFNSGNLGGVRVFAEKR